MTEPELISRAKTGDQGAFEQLVLDNQNRVYSLALRMLGDPEDAQDAARRPFSTPGGPCPPLRGRAASPPGCTVSPATPALTTSAAASAAGSWRQPLSPERTARATGSPPITNLTPPSRRSAAWPRRRWRRDCGPARPPAGNFGHAGAVRPVLPGDRSGTGPGPGHGKIPDCPGPPGSEKNFDCGRELFASDTSTQTKETKRR